jgi:hypothetical protein
MPKHIICAFDDDDIATTIFLNLSDEDLLMLSSITIKNRFFKSNSTTDNNLYLPIVIF